MLALFHAQPTKRARRLSARRHHATVCIAASSSRYSQWGRPACDFDSLRASSENHVTHAVVEYSKGGCLNAGETRDEATSCMAAFMMWMRPGMYFSCVDPHESREGRLPPYYAEWRKPLGPATGPAQHVGGKWTRSFQHPSLSICSRRIVQHVYGLAVISLITVCIILGFQWWITRIS